MTHITLILFQEINTFYCIIIKMSFILIILLPFFIISLWLFFRFSPKQQKNKCKIYNLIIISVAIFFCLLYSYRTYTVMINTNDSAWWLILSILGSLFIFSVTLIIGSILRNHLFFRTRF